jgi:predicted  nucleic acid-binding Zn-ribbon protein
MASVKEIVGQIEVLALELSRVIDGELAAGGAEARAKIDALSTELEVVRNEREEALAARQGAESELDVAEKRIEALVLKLKDARQATAEAGEEAQRGLRRQLDAMQSECDDARAELDRERSVRKRLEKGAAADEKRLGELEKSLAASKALPKTGGDAAELRRLQSALTNASEEADKERQLRVRLEAELAAVEAKTAAMEAALPLAEEAEPVAAGNQTQRADLEAKLRLLEAELLAEQQMCRRYARECAGAQKRIDELEKNGGAAAATLAPPVSPAPAAAKVAADKQLPHELRPAPNPGALFRPDWDLRSLPCASAEQILHVWASVSNVQLSLEGYPSQYCSAYLVVLKQGKQKQLYTLFNLKGIKHVLVCVPSTPPKDEATLAKLVGEGQKYLQMSGFDLEKLAAADIPKRLEPYFSA